MEADLQHHLGHALLDAMLLGVAYTCLDEQANGSKAIHFEGLGHQKSLERSVKSVWQNASDPRQAPQSKTGRNKVLHNPSERRPGHVRIGLLLKQYQQWKKTAKMLTPCFSGGSHPAGGVDVPKIFKTLGDAPCTVFDSKMCYKHLRLIRMLCLTTARVPADTKEAWQAWRSMSKHVEK